MSLGTIATLKTYYARLLREHGDTPEAVQYRDRPSQEARMRVLADVGDLRDAKILDFGCGTGHLLTVLRRDFDYRGEYVGYDLVPEMVETAQKKFPDARFEARDILADGVNEDFDYVFICGVFNNLLDDNWGFESAALAALWPRTRVALSFNNLSTYVDFFDDGLYYVAPEDVFRFCKSLSPSVVLRHEYEVKPGQTPFEFTTYVYRKALAVADRKRFR